MTEEIQDLEKEQESGESTGPGWLRILIMAFILLFLLYRVVTLIEEKKSTPLYGVGVHDPSSLLDPQQSQQLSQVLEKAHIAGLPVGVIFLGGDCQVDSREITKLYKRFDSSLELPDSGLFMAVCAGQGKISLVRGERLKYILNPDDMKRLEEQIGHSDAFRMAGVVESLAEFIGLAARDRENYLKFQKQFSTEPQEEENSEIGYMIFFGVLGITLVFVTFVLIRGRCPRCGARCEVEGRELRSQDATEYVRVEKVKCPECSYTRERKIIKR